MTRTDVHAPSKIQPEDYYFVGMEYQKIEDIGSAMFMKFEREKIQAHMAKTGGKYSKHRHGGNCHICGAHAIYTALFYHVPTNTYIRTGMDCAEKLDMGDLEMFRTFRKNVHDALARKAGNAKAKAMLECENLSRVWEIFESEFKVIESVQERRNNYNVHNSPLTFDEKVSIQKEGKYDKICSIVNTVIRYGEISDNQLNYLKSLVEQFDNADKVIENAQKEREQSEDCPNGDKVQITGIVLKKELSENAYGCRIVMTVKDNKGFTVWGTVPTSLNGVEKGDKVEFLANVQQSNRDSKFGFFKRPTKAKRI